MGAMHDLMTYRTMRAVQQMAEPPAQVPQKPPSRWKRWQAAVYRFTDKLVG